MPNNGMFKTAKAVREIGTTWVNQHRSELQGKIEVHSHVLGPGLIKMVFVQPSAPHVDVDLTEEQLMLLRSFLLSDCFKKPVTQILGRQGWETVRVRHSRDTTAVGDSWLIEDRTNRAV